MRRITAFHTNQAALVYVLLVDEAIASRAEVCHRVNVGQADRVLEPAKSLKNVKI